MKTNNLEQKNTEEKNKSKCPINDSSVLDLRLMVFSEGFVVEFLNPGGGSVIRKLVRGTSIVDALLSAEKHGLDVALVVGCYSRHLMHEKMGGQFRAVINEVCDDFISESKSLTGLETFEFCFPVTGGGL